MRGDERLQEEMFSYGSLSQRVPLDHPLRRVRVLADEAMQSLSAEFEGMYSKMGRPSVPPEQMLRALLLQLLYSVRSERMLVEQMEYNLLFRWFVGLGMNERVWDATSFTKNRERLLSGEVAHAFFASVVEGGAAEAVVVRRTLHRRWDADRGVGVGEELQGEAWSSSGLVCEFEEAWGYVG
jgi:transposase